MDGQKAYVYGAEYQMHTVSGYMRQFHDQDVPCALCLKRNKSAVKMFPGKNKELYFFIESDFNMKINDDIH